MKEFSVSGQKRATTGKKAAKELRKEGLVPCNLYGDKRGENNLPEAVAFAIPATQLRKVVYSPDVYVEYALDMIHDNYDKVRVEDIARYIGINRSYLANIFKKKTGMSPQQYLMQFKLKKARELLMDTDLPIQNIAMQVGYDNPLTFSKIFKNYYGESPRTYRSRKDEYDQAET